MVPHVTQLPQATTDAGTQATAPTPSGNLVQGVLGMVSAARTDLWSKPVGGVLLYAHAMFGTQLLVTGESGAYYGVLMSDGSTGWVRKSDINISEEHLSVEKPVLRRRRCRRPLPLLHRHRSNRAGRISCNPPTSLWGSGINTAGTSRIRWTVRSS